MGKIKDLISIDSAFAHVFATIAFICGWTITFIGLFTPPKGIVDQSLLWILGQSLAFAGSVVGITHHVNASLDKFKMEINSKDRSEERTHNRHNIDAEYTEDRQHE